MLKLFYRLEDFLSLAGVQLDEEPFLLGKWTRLVKNDIIRSYLPDVME